MGWVLGWNTKIPVPYARMRPGFKKPVILRLKMKTLKEYTGFYDGFKYGPGTVLKTHGP